MTANHNHPIFSQPLTSEKSLMECIKAYSPEYLMAERKLQKTFSLVTDLIEQGKVLDDIVHKNIFLLLRDKEKMYRNCDFNKVHEKLDEIMENLKTYIG